MQRRSLVSLFAAMLGFAATAKAAAPKREDVFISFERGRADTLLTVRFNSSGASIAPGTIAPLATSNRLVVLPHADEWTERKARALSLGESLLDHIQHLHETGKA